MTRLIGIVVVGTLIFTLGFWSGNRFAHDSLTRVSQPMPLQPGSSTFSQIKSDSPISTYINERDWIQLVAAIEAARANPDQKKYVEYYNRMLIVARDLQVQEAPGESARLLEAFIELNPFDAEALHLLSDAYALDGNVDESLNPLITLLAYPPSDIAASRARVRLQALIENEEERFVEEQDYSGLVSFYQSLVDREPQFDGHRLGLARALLKSGDVAAARTLSKEIGNEGVDEAQLQALKEEISQGNQQVAIEREHNTLHANALMGDSSLRLLVDTGASMSVIRRNLLTAKVAEPLFRQSRVTTAAGVINADVYRINELNIGSKNFTDVEVLAMDSLPEGTDGLLGMDLLDEVSGIAIPGSDSGQRNIQ